VARSLAPGAPEPLEALGRLHDRRGSPGVAAGFYAQATERLHDTDARLLYALALARYRSGALPAARDAARRAIATDSTMAEGHYLLGLIAHDLHLPREATTALEQAVRLNPSMGAARQELALLYREQGRTADEAAQLRALVAQGAGLNRSLDLAQSQTRAGDYPAALDTLVRSEAAAPGDSRVALAIGRVHLAEAEASRSPAAVQAALDALERALGGTARRGEGLALYGRALHLSGDAAAAERLLAEAVRTSPVQRAAFAYLAEAAESLGHHAVARDALLNLDALEGNTASAETRRWRAHRIGARALDASDPAMAVQYLTRASTWGRRDASTLGLLARAHWMLGNRDEARQTLAAALELAGADADLRQLERTFR
jgi:tetratricopeptide (TPR) repeat protein